MCVLLYVDDLCNDETFGDSILAGSSQWSSTLPSFFASRSTVLDQLSSGALENTTDQLGGLLEEEEPTMDVPDFFKDKEMEENDDIGSFDLSLVFRLWSDHIRTHTASFTRYRESAKSS